MEDFRVTLERTGMAASWDESALNEWIEKGRAMCGGVLEEATITLEKAEAIQAEEARVCMRNPVDSHSTIMSLYNSL
jgi:hypothetical protein